MKLLGSLRVEAVQVALGLLKLLLEQARIVLALVLAFLVSQIGAFFKLFFELA